MNTPKRNGRMMFTSIISLLLCVSMVVGTTFAWFTDSVRSGTNIIATGNLDVELDYWNGSQWKTVAAASDILTGDNWEPGYTDVAYLRIKNVGDLALNYQFGVNIHNEDPGTNMAGERFLLSDYIYFDVADVNGETNGFATREDAMKIATNTTKISDGYSKPGTLLPGSGYEYVALVVYMPTSVGNIANHDGSDIPEITLGIHVNATQVPHEYDSFGQDYDSGASNQLPEIPLSKGGTVSASAPAVGDTEAYVVSNSDGVQIGSVQISGDSVETGTTNITIEIIPDEPNANVTTSTNQKKETFNISVNGIKSDNNADITVTLNYRTGLAGVQVFHYDKEIQDVDYDPTTGIVTFKTKSFSPYTIVHTVETNNGDDGNEVDSEEALIAAVAKGGTAKVSRNISLSSTLAISKSVTLDLNGYSIACGTKNAYIQITGDGELTVTDSGSTGSISGFTNDQGKIQAGVINMGAITVDSGTVKGGILNHGGTVIMDGGAITSDFTGISTDGGTVIVNGGTISGNNGGIQIDPYESKKAGAVTVNAGTINGGIRTYYHDDAEYGLIHIIGGIVNGGVMNNGTLTVTGGTINDGINNFGGTVIVENGTIQSNFTGIYSDSGSITVRGGTIHGNNQGICNDYNKRDAKSSVVTINGGSVTCNEPSADGTGPVRVGIMNYGYSEVYVSAGYVTSFGVTNNEMNPYHGIISVTGGTFQQDPSEYLATGYQAALNSDNRYVVSKGDNSVIASEEALRAAIAKGGKVKVATNIALTSTIEIPAGLEVELEMSECEISTAEESEGKHYHAFENKGTLTLSGKGGILSRGIINYGDLILDGAGIVCVDTKGDQNGVYAVRNYAGSTFTMKSGLVNVDRNKSELNSGEREAGALWVEEGAYATLNGGIINNKNTVGSFSVDNAGTMVINEITVNSAESSVANKGTLTINGGSFNCEGVPGNSPTGVIFAPDGKTIVNAGRFQGPTSNFGFCVKARKNGTVLINGGNFLQVNGSALDNNGTIVVSGGTFHNPIDASHIAEGYEVKTVNNTYVVSKKIEETTSIANEEALIAAFAKGGTVKLSGNITVSGQVWNQNPVTLDLNGYTITCKTQGQLQPGQPVQPGQIIAANEMIIIDSGSTGSIVGATLQNGSIGQCVNNNNALTIKGGTFHGGIMNYGTLTVDGGVITTASYGIMSSGGNVTVNGGSVEGYYAGIRNDYFEPIQTGIVTVNGGSVTSSNGVGILNYGNREVYVTGGYVSSLGTVSTDQASYTGIVSVTGGTFQQDPSGFLAAGYMSELNSQSLFVVSKA